MAKLNTFHSLFHRILKLLSHVIVEFYLFLKSKLFLETLEESYNCVSRRMTYFWLCFALHWMLIIKTKPCVALIVTIGHLFVLCPIPKVHVPLLSWATLQRRHYQKDILGGINAGIFTQFKWCCFITKGKRFFRLVEKGAPEIFTGNIDSCKRAFMSCLIFA